MALQLWEALKEAIPVYTGLSPATFFTVLALALAVYHVAFGLFGSSDRPREREEESQPLPPPVQLGESTEEKLKQYDGTDPKKPLLMAIKGQIYDVSLSRSQKKNHTQKKKKTQNSEKGKEMAEPELEPMEEPPSPPPSDYYSSPEFDKDRHVTFLQMMYQLLPWQYQNQEINRLTLAYFVISGLDLLSSIDRVDKDAVASWVLSFQAHPKSEDEPNDGQFYGFHGSRTSQFPGESRGVMSHNGSHLASTYCALSILKIVGYNLSSIDSEMLLTSMRNLQQPDGSFMPIHIGAETDLRFMYCAAAICFMLEDWRGMDKEKAKEYIINCQSYDGGFGLTPGLESHGGATYCAVASLRLMGFIGDDLLSNSATSSIVNVPLLLSWILQRQASNGGFQGRPNKDSDTCYAFWVGATLRILGGIKFIDEKRLHGFLLTCQSEYGGFSKFPGQFPDLYHSYYGITAFSLLGESGMSSLCVELGITDQAATGI